MSREFTIGKVAQTAGCKVQTIRYYEQIGLLPAPHRSAGNQRLYDQSAIDRLTFIRHARDLGFPLQAIRDLLTVSDDPAHSCADADRIAAEQLVATRHRIKRLQALAGELERMVRECQGGKISECRVIEVLSDHSLCEATDHGAVDGEAR